MASTRGSLAQDRADRSAPRSRSAPRELPFISIAAERAARASARACGPSSTRNRRGDAARRIDDVPIRVALEVASSFSRGESARTIRDELPRSRAIRTGRTHAW